MICTAELKLSEHMQVGGLIYSQFTTAKQKAVKENVFKYFLIVIHMYGKNSLKAWILYRIVNLFFPAKQGNTSSVQFRQPIFI